MEDKLLNIPAIAGKYHPGVYDRLNSFHHARQAFADHRHRITALGEIFVRHRMHERFGLTLLHKRFDLFGDEYLTRTFELRQNVVYKSPTPRRIYAVPCAWCVQRSPRGQWLFYPIEFVNYSEVAQRRADELEHQDAFMSELAEQLDHYDVRDVFGVATTGILALPCREGEILSETTNLRRRLVTVRAESHIRTRHDELTETFWTFRRDVIAPQSGVTVQCRTVASTVSDTATIAPYTNTALFGSARMLSASARS